jgi:hypothetical protein
MKTRPHAPLPCDYADRLARRARLRHRRHALWALLLLVAPAVSFHGVARSDTPVAAATLAQR